MQFEYKTIVLSHFDATQPRPPELNRQGADGWELVSAVFNSLDSTIICFMKKEK